MLGHFLATTDDYMCLLHEGTPTNSLQIRICYFDNNCISHQNCNCWHGFMGWY